MGVAGFHPAAAVAVDEQAAQWLMVRSAPAAAEASTAAAQPSTLSIQSITLP
jgi:hypothetical protein